MFLFETSKLLRDYKLACISITTHNTKLWTARCEKRFRFGFENSHKPVVLLHRQSVKTANWHAADF